MAGRDMTTPELVRIVGKAADVSQVQTKAVIAELHRVYATELSKGNSVVLNGIGTLSIKTMAPRAGVNPATGKKIKIPSRKKVAFKSFPGIKKSINDED